MSYEVHPAAAVFPMLPDDELQALADDIASNGLQQPLVLWLDETTGELLLLDGRNRLAACHLAGVEPEYVKHDGDPIAYVLGANNHRRHMSKGQRAIAGVLALDSGPLIINRADAARRIGVSDGLVSWARTVAGHAPSLVERVLRADQPMSLKDAYDEARRLEQLPDTEPVRLARLDRDAPDLTALVRAQGMTLSEAEAAYRQRETDRMNARRDGERAAAAVVTELGAHLAAIVGGIEAGAPLDLSVVLAQIDDVLDHVRRIP